MREQVKDINRLSHIYDACKLLQERGAKDTLELLDSDPIKFYGYVKLVEIIGEATYKLTKEYRNQHPEVPWKMMEGMRHVLVHDYYCISASKLWGTITDDIPVLTKQIKQLIDEMTAE